MKKIVFALLSIVLTLSVSAQSGKVISAYNYLQAYNNKEGVSNLDEATKNIDLAAQDESTSKTTKTWWYRAQIYQNISNETTLKDKYPKASLEALLSYQNMQKMVDPKFKDWADAVENMKALTVSLHNDGVTAYQAKKYTDAYTYFMGISDINDILVAHSSKVTESTLSSGTRNAALSAESAKDTSKAIVAYKKFLQIGPDSVKASVYHSLIGLNKKTNPDEAKRLADEGIAKFPDNSDLLIDKINFYVTENKYTEAIDYLKKLQVKDPNNIEIIYALANSYDNSGDSVNAKKVYLQALAINPDHFKSNLGLGALLFNTGNKINNQMNALSMSAADQKKSDALKVQRNALYAEAKPYLAKAQAKDGTNKQVEMALKTIEALTGGK
ncbi:MAG: photosystem assembly protein Ycf3 [Bacteroidetes bacterium]|nr:photosystem assembly protein Ycf3 [Bacteroidota bacterium]